MLGIHPNGHEGGEHFACFDKHLAQWLPRWNHPTVFSNRKKTEDWCEKLRSTEASEGTMEKIASATWIRAGTSSLPQKSEITRSTK